VQEAKAKEKVALAEIEYGYSGKGADHTKVLVAKAESAYAVAKERCDDQSGNAKDVCVKEAKAVEVKALADAKLGKKSATPRKTLPPTSSMLTTRWPSKSVTPWRATPRTIASQRPRRSSARPDTW
jgi:hypothetical protein